MCHSVNSVVEFTLLLKDLLLLDMCEGLYKTLLAVLSMPESTVKYYQVAINLLSKQLFTQDVTYLVYSNNQ